MRVGPLVKLRLSRHSHAVCRRSARNGTDFTTHRFPYHVSGRRRVRDFEDDCLFVFGRVVTRKRQLKPFCCLHICITLYTSSGRPRFPTLMISLLFPVGGNLPSCGDAASIFGYQTWWGNWSLEVKKRKYLPYI
jgi:hypothetical protein